MVGNGSWYLLRNWEQASLRESSWPQDHPPLNHQNLSMSCSDLRKVSMAWHWMGPRHFRHAFRPVLLPCWRPKKSGRHTWCRQRLHLSHQCKKCGYGWKVMKMWGLSSMFQPLLTSKWMWVVRGLSSFQHIPTSFLTLFWFDLCSKMLNMSSSSHKQRSTEVFGHRCHHWTVDWLQAGHPPILCSLHPGHLPYICSVWMV